MTKPARKALIIGAGIAGPVTGILLRKAGIDAQVFEGWPYSTGLGGGLQLAPNGMHVLAEIGLADEMIRRGSVAEANPEPGSAPSTGICSSVSASPR
jgi:2-polyprenyl-6-methoxyphenol hydroxylase-like FAD-dependent oxidoreductase